MFRSVSLNKGRKKKVVKQQSFLLKLEMMHNAVFNIFLCTQLPGPYSAYSFITSFDLFFGHQKAPNIDT